MSLFKSYLLGLAPVCVLAIGTVAYGEKREGLTALIVLAAFGSLMPLIYQLTWKELPLGIVVGVPIIGFLLALSAIRHLLETNGMAYQVRLDTFSRTLGTN